MAKDQLKYQQAFEEWEKRVGSAKAQVTNWRIACFICLFIVCMLVVTIAVLMTKQKTYVYVAEVKPQESVVNVRSMDKYYQPSNVQIEYFVSGFIKRIMTLPLDPVVARENWLEAYGFVSGKATAQLNTFARDHDPFKDIGKFTKTVQIDSYHPISNDSYQFTWLQTIYSNQGKVVSQNLYNGIFTVVTGKQPKTSHGLLNNPLGIQIAYFTFSNEGKKP